MTILFLPAIVDNPSFSNITASFPNITDNAFFPNITDNASFPTTVGSETETKTELAVDEIDDSDEPQCEQVEANAIDRMEPIEETFTHYEDLQALINEGLQEMSIFQDIIDYPKDVPPGFDVPPGIRLLCLRCH